MDKELSLQAKQALIKLNDVCYAAKGISRSSVSRLVEEWSGDESMKQLFYAFLIFRETLAEFEAGRDGNQ